MRLTISDIPEEGLRQEGELPVTINDNAQPVTAQFSIFVFRINKKVFVEGAVRMSVTLPCSRCLKEYAWPLDTAFREEYNPVEEFEQSDTQELTEQDLDLSFYRNDELDIAELIKEQVLLSIPMKTLCRPDCKGLCTQCGKDFNEGPCGCRAEKTDPRLASLGKFKELIKDRGTT